MENNLEKEFVTYEQALALNELGFNDKVITYYLNEVKDSNDVLIPNIKYGYIDNVFITLYPQLKSQAFSFIREKYELSYSIIHKQFDNKFEGVVYSLYDSTIDHTYLVNTYEEAEEVCLNKLIKIAKENK